MNVADLHQGNRDAWNRTARAGYGSEIEAHVKLLSGGGTNLMDAEIRLLGDLHGICARAVHLQCSHGLDALSLLNLGAGEVIGIDISEEMLSFAKQKSDALGARATWIRADVLDAPQHLNGTADLVYTGKGAICWMMDIDAWAGVVFRLLKPRGRLFLFEGHPLNLMWKEDSEHFELREGATYFASSAIDDRGFPYQAALRTDPSSPVQLTLRAWTLGETVTALIRAGLRVELLEEFPEPFWDQYKYIDADEFRRLPHTFAVVASKT